MEKPKLSSIQQHIVDSRAKMAEKLATDSQRELLKIDLLKQLLEVSKKIEQILNLSSSMAQASTLDKQIDTAKCFESIQNDTNDESNDSESIQSSFSVNDFVVD